MNLLLQHVKQAREAVNQLASDWQQTSTKLRNKKPVPLPEVEKLSNDILNLKSIFDEIIETKNISSDIRKTLIADSESCKTLQDFCRNQLVREDSASIIEKNEQPQIPSEIKPATAQKPETPEFMKLLNDPKNISKAKLEREKRGNKTNWEYGAFLTGLTSVGFASILGVGGYAFATGLAFLAPVVVLAVGMASVFLLILLASSASATISSFQKEKDNKKLNQIQMTHPGLTNDLIEKCSGGLKARTLYITVGSSKNVEKKSYERRLKKYHDLGFTTENNHKILLKSLDKEGNNIARGLDDLQPTMAMSKVETAEYVIKTLIPGLQRLAEEQKG